MLRCSAVSPVRRVCAGVLAAALAVAPPWAPAPPPARAQWSVLCANCATWSQQLISYAKEVEQVANTITMRINQATMLQNQITNMISLPGQVWNQIEGNFNQTQALFQRGTQLMNSASMISANLNSYRSLVGTVVDLPAQYTRWSQQANDSVKATLAGFGVMKGQMSGDRSVVDQIRSRSSGAEGAKQAIQANTEMAGAQVNELHRLREIMLQHANMAANMYQISAERQATAEADLANFMGVAQQPERGNKRY